MPPERVTTKLTNIKQDRDLVLTGKERYPIVGEGVDKKTIHEILESYKGLNKYWDCLEKTHRAREIIGEGIVVTGSLMVTSIDRRSEYGYYYLPPHEFHAWLFLIKQVSESQVKLIVFDAALPGVIQKGLQTSDEIGPSLIGRLPVVLAGMPREWMRYNPREYHMEGR